MTSQFAPEEAFIQWGWARIMNSIDLPADLVAQLWPGWSAALVSGDRRRSDRILRDALHEVAFRWPWLECSFSWIEREVAPEHGWPFTWRTPRLQQLRLPKATLELLGQELWAMVYEARNRSGWCRIRNHNWPRNRDDQVILVAGDTPAENSIARRFADRFAAGDGTSWPPYFPGDRTSVRFEVHGGLKVNSPNEVARCPAKLVEPLWPIPPDMPFASVRVAE